MHEFTCENILPFFFLHFLLLRVGDYISLSIVHLGILSVNVFEILQNFDLGRYYPLLLSVDKPEFVICHISAMSDENV